MFMATEACINAEVIVGVASIAGGIMVAIKTEVFGVIKSRRHPLGGGMALIAIVFEQGMIRIGRLLMATGAIVFVSRLNHIVIKRHVRFPALRIMTIVARCS